VKTPTPSTAEIEASRKWYLVDADGKVLGRLATKVASILKGKHKPMYMPHLDVGDFVVIINAERIRLTGRKADQKVYFRHTGYPGGGREDSFKELIAKKPDQVLAHAIKGMLPHNRLGRQMFKKLKIYAGGEHPHVGQKPEVLALD
jgi:large subunit ribosomal protein L13